MPDLTHNHGVSYTVVRNLTNVELFVPWFPTANGFGVTLAANTTVKVAGNLFEAMLGYPGFTAQLLADVTAGKVAVSVCGDDTLSYAPVSAQAVTPATWSCLDWEYDSSSSTWVGS